MRLFDDSNSLVRSLLLILLSAGLVATAASCEEAFDGPNIQSATIDPAQIPKNDAGMTDECFTVDMTISGFNAAVDEVTIFIVEEQSRSVTASEEGTTQCAPDALPKFETAGSQVTVRGIKKTLVNGLDAGRYGIGATVIDAEGNEVTQRDIATLEIVQ